MLSPQCFVTFISWAMAAAERVCACFMLHFSHYPYAALDDVEAHSTVLTSIRFSRASGQLVASGSRDGVVRIWVTGAPEPLMVRPLPSQRFFLSFFALPVIRPSRATSQRCPFSPLTKVKSTSWSALSTAVFKFGTSRATASVRPHSHLVRVLYQHHLYP